VRYIFDFSDQLMLSIFKLGGHQGNKPELATWLAREGTPEFVLCEDVLRKLKIALSLQADDLIAILKLNEFTLSKHELSALFRRPDHKNYRECLDQVLRNFLDGMEKHYRQKAVGGK
jgi:uncharacterized protein YehS (DUF1456 family)